MKILIIKTSSLGDVLHLLPALTDLIAVRSDVEITWCVEEGFKTIPSWHQHPIKIIPVAIRRWRKRPWFYRKEFFSFLREYRKSEYDLVIDAQGLFKSACLALLAKGSRVGFAEPREKWVRFLYHKKIEINLKEHAIVRLKQLFSKIFQYNFDPKIEYGLSKSSFSQNKIEKPYSIFLHGTTWKTKHWPLSHWKALARKFEENNERVYLFWGNEEERTFANKIAEQNALCCVLPKMNLEEVASVLSHAKGVIAVDTGLGHLAAALGIPNVSLYGPTDPNLTGTRGLFTYHLSSELSCSPCLLRHCPKTSNQIQPCYVSLDAMNVFTQFKTILKDEYAYSD